MSIKKNNDEARRWLRTAREDLKAAKVLLDNRKYSHSCFLCQQAAEKAVKAVHYSMDSDPWGHSAKNLISSLSQKNTIIYDKLHMMQDKAMILDRFYIPARYPNGLPDLIPSEAYNKEDAEKAFKLAFSIVDKCGEIIKDK